MADVSPSESTRHLVPKDPSNTFDNHPSLQSDAYSVGPASTMQTHGDDDDDYSTPRASISSNLPDRNPAQTSRRPGRYANEAEYLDALRAWVAEKQYSRPGEDPNNAGGNGLIGFYGKTTLDEYAARPSLGLRKGLKEKIDRRRATVDLTGGQLVGDGQRGSRKTTVDHGAVHATEESSGASAPDGKTRTQTDENKTTRRGSMLGGLLGKKK